MDLSEIKNLIDAQGKQVETAMTKYQGQVETLGKAHQETKDEVKAHAEAFAALQADFTTLAQKGFKMESPQRELSVAEQFVKSADFKNMIANPSTSASVRVATNQNLVEMKSTTINGDGTTFPYQRPGVIPGSFVPLTVRAAMRVIPVSTNAVNSLKENSWVNSAAEVSEGAAKPESDITFSPYDVNIRTIAHWLKISKQLMDDAPAIVGYIETRLRDGLEQRIENQLINGNGTSPNLSGLTDSGNFTAYTATSDDNLIDAINRIKYTMWATGNIPDTVIVNPADWGAVERLRESANAGTYLYGAPGMGASMNPFGMNVILSTYLAAGKVIVGRFSDSALIYERTGTVVEMGFVDKDFTNNLITIRAEQRMALAVDRPAGVYFGDFTTT